MVGPERKRINRYRALWPRRIAAGLFAAIAGLSAVPAGGAEIGRIAPAVLDRVVPDATHFGSMEGRPPAVPAYRDREIIGYVFRSHAVVRSVGLSGKTLDIAVGLGLGGIITGAEILEQHEPILAIGVSSADLASFVAKFRGLDVRTPVRVLRRAPKDGDALDAVGGATISSLLMADAVFQSAIAVGRSRGILEAEVSGIDLTGFEEAGWDALIADGSLRELHLTLADADRPFAEKGARLYAQGTGPDDPRVRFIDLVAGLATPARIGRNLLGAQSFNRLAGALAPGDHLIFVAASGLYSFKGTAYVKTGRFERIQITQDAKTFQLTRDDHMRIDRLQADGAPEFREMALFVLRHDRGFDAARPWRLELVVEGSSDAGPVLAVHPLDYALPDRYLAAGTFAPTAVPSQELWRGVWLERLPDVIVLTGMLLILGTIFFLQDLVAQRRTLYKALRYGFLVVTLFWLGWYMAAQLTVLNVLTFAGALRTEFRWEYFLLEPLIFILWAFTAVALLFGGRGAFCGWLCPFGALQELLNRIARAVRVPQWRLPFTLHERLWPIKYIAFLGLFAVSLGAIDVAYKAAEVEPFKTAIVMRFAREWPFLLYVGALLGAGLVVERAFCRYLCPLGAALAIPARIRMFEWLKRRWHCGRQCNICATKCPVQAIHPNGTINPNECIYCLNCQTLYFDDQTCPPLIERRKRREMRSAAAAGEVAQNEG
ncbi:MAG: NosR/NirI family protein [Alphaproteobacteria bacterium]|nr:NosR/NirI family protein [Alphaproteobacteria bacterium]